MKKVLSFVLALCLICTLLPAGILTTQVDAATHTGTFEKYSGTLTEGYYLITYKGYTLKGEAGTSTRLANGTSISTTATSVTDPDASIVWKIAKDGSYWTLYNEAAGKYAAGNSTKNKAVLITPVTDYGRWTVSGTSTYEFVTKGNSPNKNLRNNGTNGWACYSTSTGGALTLYKLKESSAPACDHTDATYYAEVPATCTTDGMKAHYECSCEKFLDADKNPVDEEKLIIPAGHNYVDGICSNCGGKQPKVTEEKYTFSDYDAGAQYAKDEAHKLSDTVTIVTNDCHFTTELRIYSSASNNGYAIIKSDAPITAIGFNAGNNVDTLNVYGSNDEGETWTLIAGVSVTGTSYKDYSLDFDGKTYECLKLDVEGSKQVRLKTLTLKFAEIEPEEPDAPACDHANTVPIGTAKDATCTETGSTAGLKCANPECNEILEAQKEIPAKGHDYKETVEEATCTTNGKKTEICSVCGNKVETVIPASHNYVDGACSVCGAEAPILFTLGEDGSASHSDSTAAKTTYTETVNGYTLNITNASKMYPGSRDAKGNGAIKLGASGTAGSFEFTVPADVTSVVIAVAGYKDNTATVTINGTATKLTETSNKGEYCLITVDTSSTKKVSLSITSGDRAMVNSIEFVVSKAEYTYDSVTTAYATWEGALAAAEANQAGEIKLLNNVTVSELDLEHTDIVIDLNGYTLTADSVVATVKDSADGNGLIKLAEEADAKITPAATQLILWDNTTNATGYRVFDYTFINMGIDANENEGKDDASVSEQYGTTVKSFWCDINFTNTKAYTLIGSENSGLKVGFVLNLNGTSSDPFMFKSDVVASWADAEASEDGRNYAFYISVYGFDNMEEGYELTVTPIINFAGSNEINVGSTVFPEV